MLTPFEAGKTAKELGINTTRRFVLTKDIEKYHKGLMFTVKDADPEKGYATFFCLSRDPFETFLIDWKNLAYAPQSDVSPEKHALREAIDPLQVATGTTVSSPTEEYTPQVGDIVKLEGEVVDVLKERIIVRVRTDEDETQELRIWSSCTDTLTLISRKAKRRVTLEEVKAKFGEDVEIVDPLPTQQEEKAIYEKMYHVCSTGCLNPCTNKV